ncbi:hypothetical protein OsI_32805 [Oryza sativa Indica Group]|uniref:Uncharacterized protein n=1 Tax=Oryza sativa subsp. indica TaxID=39946 RepID=B8BFT2_ORYSI|nr:hypothetical protein OsI_32805 [Oryza sativa Indica Group]
MTNSKWWRPNGVGSSIELVVGSRPRHWHSSSSTLARGQQPMGQALRRACRQPRASPEHDKGGELRINLDADLVMAAA